MTSVNEYFGDWIRVIDNKELLRIYKWLQKQNPNIICPDMNDIFRAFTLLRFKDCKIVMTGQDPYPQKGVATGIAFANSADTVNLSPSLEVLKEACIDYTRPHGPINFDNTLESWEKQGVLMLNSSLTCKVNQPGAHSLEWRPFISKLLINMSKEATGLIYVLLGKQAQSYRQYINEKFNNVIECEHPSWYARYNKKMPSEVFNAIDRLMEGKYGYKIKWFNELNKYEEYENNDFWWPSPL